MNTSPSTFVLSKPTGEERLPNGVLEYINTRNRLRLFGVVQHEFLKSGITQTQIARRTGRTTAQISHLLGAPGNWTADTASTLIFAISGGVLEYAISNPLEAPPRNRRSPEWLDPHTVKWTATEGDVAAPVNFGVNGTSSISSGVVHVIRSDFSNATHK